MDPTEIAAWLPLLALIASLPVFAVLSRGRALDPDVARRHASVILGPWLRDWMIWVLSPVERLLVRRQVAPDVLNYLGVVLGLLSGAAFIGGLLPLAAWLLALAGITDILDGRIARARGIASAYGTFLDSTLDRFAEAFVFAGLAWYLSDTAWLAAATALALGGSMLVSYTRARGEALGVVCTGGLAQRAERMVLLALAAFFDPPATRWLGSPPDALLASAVVMIAAGSLATAVYRTVVIGRALRARARSEPPGEEPQRRVETGRETEAAVRE